MRSAEAFRSSPVCAIGDEPGAIRAPEYLGMLLISLTFYGDLTVNVNVASIFQIQFPVKGKLALLPGFCSVRIRLCRS